MIAVDAFAGFGRRQAALKDCPSIVIAETPNPLRQLDEASLRDRALALIDTVVWGLTAPASKIERQNLEVAARLVNPQGVPRSAQPI